MWLVLCASNDVSALWAHQGLAARGLEPVELVTSETLTHGVRWEHRVGADGASVDITLADGRRIHNDSIHGVLNRLSWIPSEHLVLIHPTDREYVTQELLAFFTSWLYALPRPVLNRPTPQGLSGKWRHVSEWIWLASKAGLTTAHYRISSKNNIVEKGFARRVVPIDEPVKTGIVISEHVFGLAAPPDVLEGCNRLAELTRTELLGVEFTESPAGPWTFAGATSLPDLRLGGQALLDVLVSVLGGQTEGD